MRNAMKTMTGVALAALTALGAHAAEPAPLDAYGDLPAIEDMAISQNGEMIAVLGSARGERRLMLLDGERKLFNQSLVGDLKVRALEWAGDETVMLTYSETSRLGPEFIADRFESFGSMLLPAEPGREGRIVFGGKRDIVTSVFGRYGVRYVDGAWKGYFGGIQLDRSGNDHVLGTTSPSLFEVDLRKNDAKKLASPPPGERVWRDWLIDSTGGIAATFDMNGRTGEWTLKGPRNEVLARGTNPHGDAGLIALGTTGETVIYSAKADDDDAARWFELPLAGGGKPTEVLPDVDLDSFYVDHLTGRLSGYVSDGRRHFLDPKVQRSSDKIDQAFKGLKATLIDWTPDFSHVLVETTGNADSGSWYLVDLTTLRADMIGIDRPAIAPEQVGPISLFEYKAGDGLQLDGVLTLPPGKAPKSLPVVILPHGGPAAHDEVRFDWWAQAFASRGYAVFQPNFRGSTNRDQAFRRAGDGEWGRKMQSDMSDGLAALAAAGIVDPRRACIMGASYGGYAALAGVTLQQGLYRCAVAVAPVSDLDLMYATEFRESGTSQVVKKSLLRQLGDRSRLDEVSPRRFAARADAPVLLIHGREDTVVPYRQSQVMADALKDAGKPFEMVELREEDHWLSRSATRKQMLAAAMAFVLEHNPPD